MRRIGWIHSARCARPWKKPSARRPRRGRSLQRAQRVCARVEQRTGTTTAWPVVEDTRDGWTLSYARLKLSQCPIKKRRRGRRRGRAGALWARLQSQCMRRFRKELRQSSTSRWMCDNRRRELQRGNCGLKIQAEQHRVVDRARLDRARQVSRVRLQGRLRQQCRVQRSRERLWGRVRPVGQGDRVRSVGRVRPVGQMRRGRRVLRRLGR